MRNRENLFAFGRFFFGTALVAYAVQQFIYGDFRPVFAPPWQTYLPLLRLWAYTFGIILLITSLSIFSGMKTRQVLAFTGGLLLALFLFAHIPYEIISDPNSRHLAVWTNPLKALALSGCCFIVAGSYPSDKSYLSIKSGLIPALEKLIPFGGIFFSIVLICFGLTHFMYLKFVQVLVPAWIPNPEFWTNVSGALLIASGLAIILRIKLNVVGILLAIMILFWLLVLHIPRAFSDASGNRGNEIWSAFDALAFSGTALLIAATNGKRKQGSIG